MCLLLGRILWTCSRHCTGEKSLVSYLLICHSNLQNLDDRSGIIFQQSSFFGVPRSPQTLHKISDSYIPTLNESGKIDAIVLDLMAANKSLGDISQELTQQFPHRFPTQNKALNYVVDLAQKYS